MAGPQMHFTLFADVPGDRREADPTWGHCFKTEEVKVVEKIKIVEKIVTPRWENVKGSDEEISDSEKACVLCMTNKPQCVLMPCMHSGFCIECSNHLQKKKKMSHLQDTYRHT